MGNHTPLCGVLVPDPSPSSGEGGGNAGAMGLPPFRKYLKERYLDQASPAGRALGIPVARNVR